MQTVASHGKDAHRGLPLSSGPDSMAVSLATHKKQGATQKKETNQFMTDIVTDSVNHVAQTPVGVSKRWLDLPPS